MGRRTITVTLNGEVVSSVAEDRVTLAEWLRRSQGLTGVHVGCEHGVCGMCTVLVDDQPVKACLLLSVQADGHRVRTVESVAEDGELGPTQRALNEHHGLQCGFCTPAFVMVATSIIESGICMNETELRDELAGIICRCTGYDGIVRAIRRVMEEEGSP